MRVSTILFLLPISLSAQTLVSTAPQNRTALLEEFTAINCPICPQGHTVAAGLLQTYPNDLVVVGLHGGPLAVPSGGQIDLRTTWSTSLWSQFGVSFQPSGSVNRMPFNGQQVLTRTVWGNAISSVLAQPSPVNIGVGVSFDANTRLLTVDAEVYYTMNGTGGNDRLSVLLTESQILGFQAGNSMGAQSMYPHMHALRAYLSPLWGDEIMNSAMGQFDQRTYTFTVPTGWNISNCAVVAFIGEFQSTVYQVTEVPALDLSTGVEAGSAIHTIGVPYPNPANDRLLVPVEDDANAHIEFRDASGRSLTVPYTNATPTLRSVDISSLPDGIYMVGIPGGTFRRFSVVH